MSITDELREWAARELASWKMARERYDALAAIADRIDAEHERMFLDLTSGMEPMDAEHMAEHGWVKLPVDADGVPIRVGDTVEEVGEDPTRYTVCGVGTLQDRPAVFYGNPSKYGYADGWDFAENVCHVQPDSWERIIEDAVKNGMYDHDNERIQQKLVERCQRLAGEA